MSFFYFFYQMWQNHKFAKLDELDLEFGDRRGSAAKALWLSAGSYAQSVGTDGVINRLGLARLVPVGIDEALFLAGLLVQVGLWHTAGHECGTEHCATVKPGQWIFHDWYQMRYTPAEQTRTNRDKRRELQDSKLVAAVWARDCLDPDVGLKLLKGPCRYCGTLVKKSDTKSPIKPHMDHVDPRKAIGPRNVVLACQVCNQKKGNRTPKAAGMILRPPPRPEPEPVPPSDSDTDTASCDVPSAATASQEDPALGSSSPRPCVTARGHDEMAVDEAEGSGDGRVETGSQEDPALGSSSPRPCVTTSASPDRPDRSDRVAATDDAQGRAGDCAGSPAPIAPPSVSPVVDDRSPVSPAVPDRPDPPPPDQDDRSTDPDRPENRFGYRDDTEPISLSSRGCAPGEGQGLGKGWGAGKGEPPPDLAGGEGSSQSQASRRRRRRRRSRTPTGDRPPSVDGSPSWDAGAPPPGDHGPAGGFGSPYFGGWPGPADPPAEGSCSIHHLPNPCWRCGNEFERECLQ